jgi:uncharacterized protein YuzE
LSELGPKRPLAMVAVRGCCFFYIVLTIWFDDPAKEHIAEETSDEVIHMKDKDGKIIGIEILNYDHLNQNYSFEHVRMTG